MSKKVTEYWVKYYVNKGLCSLCGNSGIVDTSTTAISAAGVNSGQRTFCICPNGQLMRKCEEKAQKKLKA